MQYRTQGSAVRMPGLVAGLALLIGLAVVPAHAVETFSPARVAVYLGLQALSAENFR